MYTSALGLLLFAQVTLRGDDEWPTVEGIVKEDLKADDGVVVFFRIIDTRPPLKRGWVTSYLYVLGQRAILIDNEVMSALIHHYGVHAL